MSRPLPLTASLIAAIVSLVSQRLTVAQQPVDAPIPVTVDNFIRAETDRYFAKFVTDSGLGKIAHERELTPIDHQNVIRMNRDTLYSFGIFDLDAGPVTITLPDSDGQFMSLQIINEDHYAIDVVYAPTSYVLSKEKAGTRYAVAGIRTFVNPNDPQDVERAHALQDAIKVEQAAAGAWEGPNWDQASLTKIREAVLALMTASGGMNSTHMFGRKDQVDPVQHLLGTAGGWGGNPRTAAMYFGVAPAHNDGNTPYELTVRDVPVDGFWSISVYNKDGFFEQNAQNSYTINNVTAKPSADGSVTVHFGGDENMPNYIPITPGWNYLVRLYRPRPEVLDGSWKFPDAQPATK